MNNPLKFIDPTGMSAEDPFDGNGNPPPLNGNIEIQVTKQDNLPKQELHLDTQRGTRQEGRGGFRFTDKYNTRSSEAPQTNSDVESREVGTLTTLFGSVVNLLADFFGSNDKKESSPTNQTNTISSESPTSVQNGTKGTIYSKSYSSNPWGGSKESSYNGTADSIRIRRREEKSGNTIITIKVSGTATK
jgi:hypothetical protein